MRAIVLLLTIMVLVTSTACVVDALHLKYSELVNVSIEDFAASINNNVSALLHDIKLANEVHDYDTIVKSADLIKQNERLAWDLSIDFQSQELYVQRDLVSQATDPIFRDVRSGTPTDEIIQDARKRVKERNADIAEQERERILKEAENATLEVSPTTSAVSTIPNKGFGNYTLDGQDEIKVSVKTGTDLIHMMAMEELPTDYGYTKDSAEYTVTSTGKKIKGYIDYTLDGYVVVMQPRRSSLTKGEFMDLLDTFERVD